MDGMTSGRWDAHTLSGWVYIQVWLQVQTGDTRERKTLENDQWRESLENIAGVIAGEIAIDQVSNPLR